MSELEEELEEARADQAKARGLLADRHRLVEEAERELARLDRIVEGLEYVVAKRRGVSQARLVDSVPDAGSDNGTDWRQLTRPAATLRVLRAANKPLGPAAIAKELNKHGRNDSPRKVSVVLNKLRARNDVKSEGFGQWVPVEAGASNGSEPRTP